jgi:hypothetical protein
MAAGKVLGWATWQLAHERRYITEVNIRQCFGELQHVRGTGRSTLPGLQSLKGDVCVNPLLPCTHTHTHTNTCVNQYPRVG